MTKIFEFKILHEGWEMDNEGWIEEETDGNLHRRLLMTTNHLCIVQMTMDELNEKIKETEKVLEGLTKAKELMENRDL